MDQEKLHSLEDKCIQEHAPACTAACPLHVDGRGICKEVAKGDFAAGLKIFRKAAPFPGILSRTCDQPCKAACLRKDIGGALALGCIERALVDYGGKLEPTRALPPKSKRVAVIGAGVSGLIVAHDLAKKGYPVVIFEKEAIPGGILNQIPADVLSPQMLMEDLNILEVMKVQFQYKTMIQIIAWEQEESVFWINGDSFQVVYVGSGMDGILPEPLDDAAGKVLVDPLTYATAVQGIFAGGSLVSNKPVWIYDHRVLSSHSVVQAMSDGRRAAVSMDRYLQKVSLTASRQLEGPYQTRLYTNLAGIESLTAVECVSQAELYLDSEAIEEAQRCIQCECMECVKDCVFLEQYGSYPKRYLREIYNNLSIVQGTRHKNQMINSCSLCGLCGEICPESLNMAEVCLEARQMMVDQKRMPPSAHDFALRDMQFSNSEHFSLFKHHPGTAASYALFFPGCQLSASAPGDVGALYQLICDQSGIKEQAGIGLALGCCGAPAEWAGRKDLFNQTRQQFLDIYQQMGTPQLILACSSCYHIFQKYYPEVNIKSLWVCLDEMDLVFPSIPDGNQPVSIHDPCTTRYETAIQNSVRNLVVKMGYQIEELPLNREKTECCSYGGLMWLANPELARKVVDRRIQAGELDYVTYCAMCRDFFANRGKATSHLVDLLFHPQELGAQKSRSGPDFSTRHENRARLKQKLLKTLWGEVMNDLPLWENIPLILSDSMRTLLEERMILVEDIQQVIAHAEKTQNKLLNRENGHFLANFNPVCVTYWVEYQPVGDGYEVFNAYCHRMTIEDEVRS